MSVADASEALLALVENGLVEVVATPASEPDITIGRVLDSDELRRVVADPQTWRPQPVGQVYHAVPRAAADAAYNAASARRQART